MTAWALSISASLGNPAGLGSSIWVRCLSVSFAANSGAELQESNKSIPQLVHRRAFERAKPRRLTGRLLNSCCKELIGTRKRTLLGTRESAKAGRTAAPRYRLQYSGANPRPALPAIASR